MNILIIGASGNIGSRILKEAISRGHDVTATARKRERIEVDGSARTVALDVFDVDATCALARDADVIVSALSPRGDGDPMALATAFGSALIEVAHRTAKRLMVVGGAGSLVLPDGSPVAETLPDFIRPESMAMRAVRDALKASDVDWTFFSPAGFIFPGERTGKFRLGTTTMLFDQKNESRISVEDYAVAFIDEIERPAHRRSQMTIAY
jgi:hypothetical protein